MKSAILCLFLVAALASMTAAEPGYVSVYNSGSYVIWIVASYKEANGQTKSISTDSYPIGQTKTITFPDGATNIVVTSKVGVSFGVDSDIFTKTYSTPPKDCFKVWGITLSTNWAKIEC
ncbi:unnamed protein product [Bemisia tabaci]|uniref:Uncharacterized protein n=1 Tax=Bemisia tabaci TaxID=7038 RepID=A0A9P0CAH2_BEMTA|nr:unnamed protein product [Bemisia tabaci]